MAELGYVLTAEGWAPKVPARKTTLRWTPAERLERLQQRDPEAAAAIERLQLELDSEDVRMGHFERASEANIEDARVASDRGKGTAETKRKADARKQRWIRDAAPFLAQGWSQSSVAAHLRKQRGNRGYSKRTIEVALKGTAKKTIRKA